MFPSSRDCKFIFVEINPWAPTAICTYSEVNEKEALFSEALFKAVSLGGAGIATPVTNLVICS